MGNMTFVTKKLVLFPINAVQLTPMASWLPEKQRMRTSFLNFKSHVVNLRQNGLKLSEVLYC